MRRKLMLIVPAALGTLAVVAYLSQSLGIDHFSARVSVLLALMIGPLAAFGVIRFTDELPPRRDSMIRSSCTLLVIAFALLTLMVSVQQMSAMRFGMIARPSSIGAEAGAYVFQLLSSVQLGIDVAFDIFYCLGMMCLCVVIWEVEGYGRYLALVGIALAAMLLVVNLVAFPHTPSSIGLIDFGPATGVWWLALIVARTRVRRRSSPIEQNAV
jgi:hypothetical protein